MQVEIALPEVDASGDLPLFDATQSSGLDSVNLAEEARAVAAECFAHTLRTELGRADTLSEEWATRHPRVLLECGHINLARAVLGGDVKSDAAAIDTYLSAAEMAQGVHTILINKQRLCPTPFSQRWGVWAAASVTQISGTPTRHREFTPLRAMQQAQPCPCQRAAAEGEEEVVRRTEAGSLDAALKQLRILQDAVEEHSDDRTPPPSGEAPLGTDDADTTYADTFLGYTGTGTGLDSATGTTGTASMERGSVNAKWSNAAIQLSDSIEGAAAASPDQAARRTPADVLELEASIIGAEAHTLAALLQLKASRYVEAGVNLRKAWEVYQPLRLCVRRGELPAHLEDDVKLGVGILVASAVELPDGLRKVLGSVGSLATPPDEVDWLFDVFSGGGHRSLHAGVALVLRQLSKPRSHIEDTRLASREAQVLQALLLRHPNSVILHLLCSAQRRRYGDPNGALDAVAAARRAWRLPTSAWHSGRQLNSPVPPAVNLAHADAHLSALHYKEAARLYRETLDAGTMSGEPLAFQGRAAIHLAGAMTFLGLQKWPSHPWGNADEWILRSVVASRSDRQDEQAVAAIAARYSTNSQLRPLLPFWLLFLMGDLEALGPHQQQDMVALLERLGRDNPSRPPKEDFLAYAEGRGLYRLLLGAALRGSDPERAHALWCATLTDRNLPNESVAIAYTQCLMGEEAVKDPYRMELGLRVLIKGSQLPGDRTPYLRKRYGAALLALPWRSLQGLLPLAWSIVLRVPEEENSREASEASGESGGGRADHSRRYSTATSQWMKPVMKQRVETMEMVNSLLGKLNATGTGTGSAPSTLQGSLEWRSPAPTQGVSESWRRPPAIEVDTRVSSVSVSRRTSVVTSPTAKRVASRVSITLPASSRSSSGEPTSQLLRAVEESLRSQS